jgi:uncharacterized protein
MSERDGYEPGVPCWVDHSSSDPGAAARFYSALFGWETEDLMPPDAPGRYIGCRLRGRDVAAIGSQASEGPPMWGTYVWVEDAEAAAAGAKRAGGALLSDPLDVFDAGRMAVLQDPSGAVISVWQAGRHRGAGIVNEPGAWCWAELTTDSVEAARRFYGDVFGWQAQPLDAAGGDHYLLWYLGGEIGPDTKPIAGMAELSGEGGHPPNWGIAFAVAGTDGTVARAEELGGGVVMAPFDTSVGRTAVLTDPLGAGFAVIRLENV